MTKTIEDALDASDARKRFSDTLNRVRYAQQRIVLKKHHTEIAAIVSMADLAVLRALEDKIDIDQAKAALATGKRHSLEKVKRSLRLK